MYQSMTVWYEIVGSVRCVTDLKVIEVSTSVTVIESRSPSSSRLTASELSEKSCPADVPRKCGKLLRLNHLPASYYT